MAKKANKTKMVTLVFTEIVTPYKAGEIATFSEEDAQKILTRDKR